MRFSLKLFLCIISITATALGIGGYYFIQSLFYTALEREVSLALDENILIRFAFETATLNIPSLYERLQDRTVEQIGASLEMDGYSADRYIRISNEDKEPLYTSEKLAEVPSLLDAVWSGVKAYRIAADGDRYYIQCASELPVMDRLLYLETFKDASSVFEDRAGNFVIFQRVSAVILFFEAAVTWLMSIWLTRPVAQLSLAAKNMAKGDYSTRAVRISSDELGDLTLDFNTMAQALEEQIAALQNEARAKEDFVAAVTHELKTPLTSIIGYAQLLRSYKVSEDQLFMSVDYIYNEGKRLETLSLRLLDLIVLKRHEITLVPVQVSQIFEYLEDMFGHRRDIEFLTHYEPGAVLAELSLIKTVFLNLVDNARKAYTAGGRIEVVGYEEAPGRYRFIVTDYGCGVPPKELDKITEAFYMVDKSRSRSRNGAGVGLALCADIILLHDSRVEFESIEGEGTSVSFTLALDTNA